MVTTCSACSLSVVIPCYNEATLIEASIEKTLTELKQLKGKGSLSDFEILLVNDGSTDVTASRIEDKITKYPKEKIYLIDNAVNKQKGGAVLDGFKAATMDLVLFMDADLATPLYYIEEFMQAMMIEEIDLLVATRHNLKENRVNNTYERQLFSDLCIKITHLLLPVVKVSDTQCGFKMMRNDLAKELSEQVQLRNFSFDIELILIAALKDKKISEKDILWVNRIEGSKVNPVRVGMQMLKDLFFLRKMMQTYKRKENVT